MKVERPKDWSSLEKAFADKATIAGVVSAVVKGGLSVDVGVRAFMPASRSGARDAAEMEKLVGQEIRCRIIKLDVADEDVVVDRRAVLEEEERAVKERRYSEIKEGETVHGTVRSLTDYGAFVDIGGVDGLLHVADIAWGRVNKPADVLAVGQEVEVKVLKVDPAKRRISLGMKQLQPHPWDLAGEKYKAGERVRGTRHAGGRFRRVRGTGAGRRRADPPFRDVLVEESAQAVRRGEAGRPGGSRDPRRESGRPPHLARTEAGAGRSVGGCGAEVPGGRGGRRAGHQPSKFGAFVQLAEGVEGMIHVGDISAEKRINHPQEVLKMGQVVKAQVLEVDREKRRLRLGMKQLVPTSLDEYIAEHKEGDVVTGRMTEVSGGRARVELGEGIQATCRSPRTKPTPGGKARGIEGRSCVADLDASGQMEGGQGARRWHPKANRRAPGRSAASGL